MFIVFLIRFNQRDLNLRQVDLLKSKFCDELKDLTG